MVQRRLSEGLGRHVLLARINHSAGVRVEKLKKAKKSRSLPRFIKPDLRAFHLGRTVVPCGAASSFISTIDAVVSHEADATKNKTNVDPLVLLLLYSRR
ncbi:unnamed protein product [Amoebophrya sp. A120]|nr:unnamed protein product [Amoebophrya sp. A120]|eukprot:GSA120T00021069001.1